MIDDGGHDEFGVSFSQCGEIGGSMMGFKIHERLRWYFWTESPINLVLIVYSLLL